MNGQQITPSNYQLGDVVQTMDSFGLNAAGSIGIIYETYPDDDGQNQHIVSVLLVNGHDIGCFTVQEQTDSLAWLGHVTLTYDYHSPGQLMADYRNGYFRQAFDEAVAISEQRMLTGVED